MLVTKEIGYILIKLITMNKFYLVGFAAYLMSGLAYSQTAVINGQVSDIQTNEPLIGVYVIKNNGNNGTITDNDGRFALQAREGDQLSFSYVGYEDHEVTITSDMKELKISLREDSKYLSEIVVTGTLGLQRSVRELGTTNHYLDNEELTQGKVVDPILGLTSKVAGLRINMYDSKVDPDVQIVLRGVRSHTGNNAPLYVVDGVPIPSINRLNPNDIESINVLKGANAAALYGSEGVNGALIITTKKGQAGKQSISFSNTTLFEQVSKLPKQQNEFGQGMNGAYDPLQYQSWGPRFDGEMRPVGPELPDGTQWELPYQAVEDGKRSFFNTGITFQNNLALSGGDERSTYYFSVQDVMTKGIVPGDKNRRTGARFNGSRLFGKLTTSYNINYIINKNDVTPSEPWAVAYRLPANLPLDKIKDWRNDPHASPDYFFTNNQANPYFNASNQRNVTDQQTLNGNIEFDYDVTEWFSVIYRAGIYNRTTDFRNTVGKYTYSTGGRTNIAGSVDDGTGTFRRLNSDLIFNFERNFGKFSSRLILGNNIRTDQQKSINLRSSAMVVPDLFNQDNRTGELTGKSTLTDYRQVAGYGELTMGYQNNLFLTFTGRYESVSVLNKSNRAYFYPGVSASFIFSDAIAALQNNPVLSHGKFLVSYNKTGNVPLSPYQLQHVYTQTNGFPYGNQSGFSLGTTDVNPDLEPEFVTSLEVGSKLGFFKNRLMFEAAYVHSNSENGIIQADISSATGYGSAWVNAFRVVNQVVELNVSGDVIITNNFNWNVGANFTYLQSELKEIYDDVERLFTFRQNYLIVGKPYNSYMFTDYKRDPAGRVIVDPNTGNPVGISELYYGGTGTPPYQIGLNTSFSFKGFQIGAQFDWRMGAIVYTEAANRMISDGTSPLTTQHDRQPFVFPNSVIEVSPGVFEVNTEVQTQGDRTYYANFVAPVQSNYVVSANFFKLRELHISYNLPASLFFNQSLIKGITIGLVGRNLFSIWAKDNIYNDPEFVYRGGSSEGYMSWRHLPPTRLYGFNVNINL